MKTQLLCIATWIIALGAWPHSGLSAVHPATVFADHMVLQRDHVVPVWGRADADETVTVAFAGQDRVTTADSNGWWFVKLEALAASSEPRELRIGGKNVVVLKDVLVGDVWIASGQSNMAYPLGRTGDPTEVIAKSADPQLRWLLCAGSAAGEPRNDLTISMAWASIEKHNVASLSAVAYFFATDLRRSQKIPIGIIQTALGGTAAEQWISKNFLKSRTELKPIFDEEEEKQKAWSGGQAATRYEKKQKRNAALAEKAKANGSAPPKERSAPVDPAKVHFLGGLYNARIAPLQPFACRGIIWYQGEQNGRRGEQYRVLFPTLIDCWRTTWGRPPALSGLNFDLPREEAPFLFVQLPGHEPSNAAPTAWAELRDAQLYTLKTVPSTGMAVTLDVGDAENIHPKNKRPVGERLAHIARVLVYGEQGEPIGPLFVTMRTAGNRAVLTFDHVGGGLVSTSGPFLNGFELAGADGRFALADARIVGETVIVTAPSVERPESVRYAYRNMPVTSLASKEGLLAPPFKASATQSAATDK